MRSLGLGLCLALTACMAGAGRENPRRQTPELPSRWHYQVRLNDELTRLDATLCFEGTVPAEVRPGRSEAAVNLRYARWLSPLPKRRLPVEGGRIQLEPSAGDGCLEYGVDLSESGDMGRVVRRSGQDLVASPNVWLWRPSRRALKAHATLQLRLPPGVRAALPWPERAGIYELGADAFSYDSHAAFGRFERVAGSYAGVTFEAAVLQGELAVGAPGVEHWLRAAIDVAAQGPGGVPVSTLHALVVPVGDASEPVPFGTVTRGGSASLLLFVSSSASEPELLRDWVLPHELSHLFVPFVGREHAWFSEGLASYYQEVLRARAGVLTEESAFGNLARALRSARNEGTGRVLVEESRDMHQTYAYRAVYWAGAAYFLMADTELRKRSQNQRSLDSVLSALTREPEPARGWTLASLLERLDALAGEPLFTSLAELCLARPFPDVEPVLLALGAPVEGAELRDDAALAGVRHAIFAPQLRK